MDLYMTNTKKKCIYKYMVLLVLLMLFQTPLSAQTLPEWYIPLREAVYEQQLTANEIAPMYREISARTRTSLSGAPQLIMLSRCEYMMGRAYLYEERKDEAAARFSDGMDYAQRALNIRESAEAWVMLAENLSQSCVVRSVAFAMANGLNVEKYSKNALAINSRNAAASIMIASRWIYAPSPFHNYRRGIDMMSAIINECDMEKDDMFNVYSGIGYAYVQMRNSAQARTWLTRALEIYPTNRYVQNLRAGL
jgi:tetratricopeptide (TPR) repeat protein